MTRIHRTHFWIGLVGAALLAGCGSPEPGAAQRRSTLRHLDDCGQVLATLQARAIREMETRVDENMAYYFQYQEWCEAWAKSEYGDGYDDYDYGMSANAEPSAEAGGGTQSGASQYSTTNNQVAGVDEADLLKNDGSYIYIVSNGEFQIVDAWPAAEAEVITRVTIEGEPKRLFVADDHALVYSSLEPVGSGSSYYGGECVYGYDCDFTGDGRRLKITVLDITDRTNPVLVREMRFSGAYLNARRVGSAVYTAVVFPPVAFPDLEYWPEELDDYWSCAEPKHRWEVRMAFTMLKVRNRAIIRSTGLVDWLPAIQDTRYVGSQAVTKDSLLQDCSGFFEASQPDGQSFLSLVAVDIADPASFGITTIVGKPGAVYASPDALYVAARNQSGYSYYYDEATQPAETSAVHKFRLETEPVGTSYVASGQVKGRVLNQFAMDEWEGHLRMATTTGRVPSPSVHSTISVLEEEEGTLRVVGLIDQIAPTEDIRSARFSGGKAFIVTFKKTDPLFSFDLADPRNPRILGELKIPGYSTYMHMMDDSHLLAIGYDADDQGSFAWFQGILLQIFDVSDMSNPTLLHREVIGTRGSTSDAATNHLAFNYFGPLGLLALPMTICEGGSGGSYGDVMTFSGLMVYDVTVADGFHLKGRVSHADPSSTDYGACSNWWTQSNSIVKRSIFMDDFVYSVALDQIKIQNLSSLGQDVASVSLVPPASDGQ